MKLITKPSAERETIKLPLGPSFLKSLFMSKKQIKEATEIIEYPGRAILFPVIIEFDEPIELYKKIKTLTIDNFGMHGILPMKLVGGLQYECVLDWYVNLNGR